jgi:hypothetical protein
MLNLQCFKGSWVIVFVALFVDTFYAGVEDVGTVGNLF